MPLSTLISYLFILEFIFISFLLHVMLPLIFWMKYPLCQSFSLFLHSLERFEMILIKILITCIVSHIFCAKTHFWIYNWHRCLSVWPLVQHSADFESQPCTRVKKETHRAVPNTSLLCSHTY